MIALLDVAEFFSSAKTLSDCNMEMSVVSFSFSYRDQSDLHLIINISGGFASMITNFPFEENAMYIKR